MIHLLLPNPAVDRTILLENLQEGLPNRPLEVRDFPGGKSFNVAYSMNFWQVADKVCVHTILGGANGERVKYLARQKQILVQALEVDKNTRECNILVDILNQTIYPIYEAGFDLSQDLLQAFTDQLVQSVGQGDIIVISGSLMKGMPKDYIPKVFQAVKDKEVKLFVDTSGQELRSTYQALNPFVIKINDEEFNELMASDYQQVDDFVQALKEEVKPEIPIFIITLGAKGVVARIHGRCYYLSVPEIDVKNPIASGDHFLGALVSGYVAKEDWLVSLKQAIASSTSNCLYWYPHIEAADVESFLAKVRVVEY